MADRGFIAPDLPAKVKITAYDYSIYGGLDAKVEQISADAIENDVHAKHPVRGRMLRPHGDFEQFAVHRTISARLRQHGVLPRDWDFRLNAHFG